MKKNWGGVPGLRGVPGWGVYLVWGVVYLVQGSLLPGGVSWHALRQTPPALLTESQIPVKT